MPESTGQNKPIHSLRLGIKKNVRKWMNSSWPGISTLLQSRPVQDELLFPVTHVLMWEGRSLREKSGLHQSLSLKGLVEWDDPSDNGKDISGTTLGLLRRLSWTFSFLGPFESSLGPSQFLWDCRLLRLGWVSRSFINLISSP